MGANYIADFNSRPDAEYVKCQSEQDYDYFDSEWEARVDYDRDSSGVDEIPSSVAAINGQARMVERAGTRYSEVLGREVVRSDSVLLVLNRKHLRLTVKLADGSKRSERYSSLDDAMAGLRRVRAYFEGRGQRTRTWVPA